MDTTQQIAAVKRMFYAYRNGIVADVMRKAGSPYRMIFGLTLPQLSEIGRNVGSDAELSRALWHDGDVRESVMLAPMIMPVEEFSVDEALAWTADVRSTEVADVLALKLLRRMAGLGDVVTALCDESRAPLQRYAGLRAAFGLVASDSLTAKSLAERELALNESATRGVCLQLLSAIADAE